MLAWYDDNREREREREREKERERVLFSCLRYEMPLLNNGVVVAWLVG
jgi:hypothetical protein